MALANGRSVVLGLDLGSNSVGWAALEGADLTGDGSFRADGVLLVGARAFEAAVDGTLDDIERGKEKSLNDPRRQARGQRRGTERRGRRLHQLYRRLSQAGLLPPLPSLQADPSCGEWRRGKSASAQRQELLTLAGERDAALKRLDGEIAARFRVRDQASDPAELARLAHLMPYRLRAAALDRPQDPHELGRALYHLGQRRGFLSNRKAAPKDEDEGVVKTAIGELEALMEAAGARTLGEYFAGLDPEQARIRRRYTSRAQYEGEFERIWQVQREHQPALLTDALHRELQRAIFQQRPLKSQAHLIGRCEHEPKRKRAPRALLSFQRFRILQAVNHTRVAYPDGRAPALTEEQRRRLVDRLEQVEKLGFRQAKTLLGLPANCVFGFEGGGEKNFHGNITAARLIAAIGAERWAALDAGARERLVEDVLTIGKPETLEGRGLAHWGLSAERAKVLAGVKLEPGYAGLSRQALARLLPHMERGVSYMEAVVEAYGQREAEQPLDSLPPVTTAMPQITNPAVIRTLSEMRKVVNALIRRHGKPDFIRVELARDLRNPPGLRAKLWKKNRSFEQLREAARKRAEEYLGYQLDPRHPSIEKVLLADECKWSCPYTGTGFGMDGLLGQHPVMDIEHIIPRSRSLDNSFGNKTLCATSENRTKRNRTPWEAYAHTPTRWEELTQRVKDFEDIRKDGTATRKLELFLMTPEAVRERYGDFTARQLTDTRYASRLALQYLGLLYGGTVDAARRVRVQATRGAATSDMRAALKLNRVLGDGGSKERTDHRHHAVDAVAIALTTPALLKAMSDAAREAERIGRRPVPRVPLPWETFPEDVLAAIESAVTSHRVSRRVRGKLHQDTFYGAPYERDGKRFAHVRKGVDTLSAGELEEIVDPRVRDAVRAKLEAVGGEVKRLEQDPPVLPGRGVPIRRVRVRKAVSPFAIGGPGRQRHVLTDTNHHVEVLETADGKGGAKWTGEMVTRYEAHRRWKAGQPVVRTDHGPGKRFLFSLAPGESIRMVRSGDAPRLYRIRSTTWKARGYVEVEFAGINDARKKADIKAAKEWGSNPLETLRKWGCEKVLITATGSVRPSHD